jgi:hypothetical protein
MKMTTNVNEQRLTDASNVSGAKECITLCMMVFAP